MQIGLIGLGKMGYNIALNLRNHGHEVVAQDLNAAAVAAINGEKGIVGVSTISEMTNLLRGRKAVWLMVPSGKIVDSVIENLVPHLAANDIIIDGGNSNFNDSQRRAAALKEQNIAFLDCGTSGGMSGALNGACTMVGGDPSVFAF